MKLSYFTRTAGKKGGLNKLRREGMIPGVLYGQNQLGLPLCIKKEEFDAILRSIKTGSLPTIVFELHDGHATRKAVIKELQYHRTTYAIEHIDFLFVSDAAPVSVNVPIRIVGAAECAGVKLGGFIRHVIRNLKVSCSLANIPQEFTLDVRDMQVAESKRLSDIAIPQGVRPLAKMGEVAVVITKKA